MSIALAVVSDVGLLEALALADSGPGKGFLCERKIVRDVTRSCLREVHRRCGKLLRHIWACCLDMGSVDGSG